MFLKVKNTEKREIYINIKNVASFSLCHEDYGPDYEDCSWIVCGDISHFLDKESTTRLQRIIEGNSFD